jgi:hypothetical protein
MNHDPLKHEIEQLLHVEPSPQFAARVRTRVAQSRKPSPVWIRWSVGAAAVTFVAVVVAFVFPDARETVVAPPAEITVKTPAKELEQSPVRAPDRAVSIRKSAKPSTPTTAEPEVLVDPREIAAFRRFVVGEDEERIDLQKLLELREAAGKTTPVAEIALNPLPGLDPIVIEPVSFAAPKIEGERL